MVTGGFARPASPLLLHVGFMASRVGARRVTSVEPGQLGIPKSKFRQFRRRMKKARSEFAIECQAAEGSRGVGRLYQLADAGDFIIGVAIDSGPSAAIVAIQESLPCQAAAFKFLDSFVTEVQAVGGVLPSFNND